MLTVKHSKGIEVIIEAEQVEYHPPSARISDNSEAFSPATVVATGCANHIGGTAIFHDGNVYVMNDKGRTIATYHLDMDNAAEPIIRIRDDGSSEIRMTADQIVCENARTDCVSGATRA